MTKGRIPTEPPVTYEEILQLIEMIEAEKIWNFDVGVLSSIIKATYLLCLKKNEILRIQIGAVFNRQKTVLDTIILSDRDIMPDNETKTFLVEYLDYLNRKGFKTSSKSLLFQYNKNGDPYNDSTLQKYIKKYGRKIRREMVLDKIRQAGICRYYDSLCDMQDDNAWIKYDDILASTARFAGCTPEHTEKILINDIPSRFWPKQRLSDI
jgi:hypothetical protein